MISASQRRPTAYELAQRHIADTWSARASDATSPYTTFQQTYWHDFAGFMLDCVDWGKNEPAPYQLQAARDIIEHRRYSMRALHGVGKTALAALAILWFALTRDGKDWKVATTASAWRQLTKYLWPEVRKWERKLKWDVIGRNPLRKDVELLTRSIKLATGEAFAVASNDAALIEGVHADHVLFVYDEAKIIPAATFDATEGAFAGAGVDGREAYALVISTPGDVHGRFYDIHSRKQGYEDWYAQHITLQDAITAGRVSQEWADKRKLQWGATDPRYHNRVLGEFAAGNTRGVIPLAHIELAHERWLALHDSGEWADFTAVGVDVGEIHDPTTLALRHDEAIKEIRIHPGEDTMQTAGRVAGVLSKHDGYAMIDVIGIGSGVMARLKEQGYDTRAFNAGAGTKMKDESGEQGFVNKRSAAWWNLRMLLNPASGANIALPPDRYIKGYTDDSISLTGQLTAPTWRSVSLGKIKVQSKSDLKLGRSTDEADAVIQAFWVDVKKPTRGTWRRRRR